MYNVEDILARIQKGENPEDIANECAQAINAAIELDKKNKEAELQKQKEAEMAAAKANAIEEEKNELAQIIADAVMDYIDVCAPDLIDDDEDPLDGAEVRKLLDGMIPMMQSLKALQGAMPAGINPFLGAPVSSITPAPTASNKKMSDDEIIKNFLSKNVH